MKMRTDFKIGLIISISFWLIDSYYFFFDFDKVKSCTGKDFMVFMLVGIGMCAGSLRTEVNELKEENKRLKNSMEISNNE